MTNAQKNYLKKASTYLDMTEEEYLKGLESNYIIMSHDEPIVWTYGEQYLMPIVYGSYEGALNDNTLSNGKIITEYEYFYNYLNVNEC